MRRVKINAVPAVIVVPAVPAWGGSVRGWALRYALRNAWRVEPEYDVDDLLQEYAIGYLRCVARYSSRVKNASHFMRLLQRTIVNRTNTLSKVRTSHRAGDIAEIGEVPGGAGGIDTAELAVLLDQAPEWFARIIRQLVEADVSPRCVRINGRKQNRVDLVASVAGIPSARIVEAVQSFLYGERSCIQ